MKRFIMLPPKKGTKSGDKTKRKSSNVMFIRCLFCFTFLVIVLPLIYVNLNATTRPQPTVAVKKNLEGFQETLSRNGRTDATHGVFDIQAKKKSADIASLFNFRTDERDLVLTAYLEPSESLIETGHIHNPLIRNTSISQLRSITFPNTINCTTLMQRFPVDDFPLDDPFLPWIHDYFPSLDRSSINFVAQNRRKCDTGVKYLQNMRFWTPQVALFQGIPIIVKSNASTERSKEGSGNHEAIYQLATSLQESTHNSTRFQCRFHHGNVTLTTLSVFPFDYELINWIKGQKTMVEPNGKKDASMFWLNQLLFSCPIPKLFQPLLLSSSTTTYQSEKRAHDNEQPAFYVDLIPIRTPARNNYLFLPASTAGSVDATLKSLFGEKHILPPMDDAGRWQNLPICRRPERLHQISGQNDQNQVHHLSAPNTTNEKEKPYRLVACTWTSSLYHRRGEFYRIDDSAQRLREWIHFHLMVGFDHIYVYDNTKNAGNSNLSSIHDVIQSFGSEKVTYHAWPCTLCNNNRPANSNPGVRSSQYAAESSCRMRYGELSEWMSFIDTDEYMVPMKQNEDGEYSWYPVMDEMEKMNISIMKFLSSRGKPRIELTDILKDQSVCVDRDEIVKKTLQLPVEPCVGPMENKTFLEVYNCEFIRPPKPMRFQRAMKQIYRPSFVLAHFVHYSTVTIDMGKSFADLMRNHHDEGPNAALHKYRQGQGRKSAEIFMNDITQGVLVHARSVLPHETRRRSAECSIRSGHNCALGFLCEDDVEFVDELHNNNVFQNSDGSYCNCWRNKVIEEVLVPKLETLLSNKSSSG